MPELLAIQIGSGIVGTNALQLATQLLRDADFNFYKLYTMLNNGQESEEQEMATPLESKTKSNWQLNLKGIGPAKKAHIISCLEIGFRMLADRQEWKQDGKPLTSSDSIYQYIFPELYDLPHEEVWLVLLNQSGISQAKIRIAIGGLSSSAADIRVILRTALRQGHPSLALVHNHPGGSLTPSRDDDDLTKRLLQATRLIGLNLLDHIIFTDEGYYSYFNENRFLEWLI